MTGSIIAVLSGGVFGFDPINTSLTTIFDSNHRVTVGTGVSRWDPIKGTAYLTQSTAGSQPAYTTGAYNGYPKIQADGTDDFLAFNDFSASSGSHYFIAVVDSDFAGTFKYLMDSQTGRLSLGSITSTQQLGWADGSNHSVGTRPVGLAIIEWVLTNSATGRIFVNGVQIGASEAVAEQAYSAKAIGGNTKMFSHNNGTGSFLAASLVFFGHQAGIPTNDTRINLINHLARKYGISQDYLVPPVGTTQFIAAEGDSLTAGSGTNTLSWARNFTSGTTFVKNFAVGGQTVSQMDADSSYQIGNYPLPSTITHKVLTFLGGVNDLSSVDAATAETRISTYMGKSWLTGWDRVILTLPAHTDATRNGKVITLNESLRGAAYHEGLADIAGNAHYDPNNRAVVVADTVYYQGDGVHWTQGGADTVVYPLVRTAVEGL